MTTLVLEHPHRLTLYTLYTHKNLSKNKNQKKTCKQKNYIKNKNQTEPKTLKLKTLDTNKENKNFFFVIKINNILQGVNEREIKLLHIKRKQFSMQLAL